MVLAQNVVSNQRFCRASGVRRRAPRLVMEPSETLVETPCLGKPLPVGDLFVELSAGLADGADIEALLQRFLVPLLRLSGARAGAVRALSEDGSHMRLVGSVGLSQEVLAAEQSVDRHCGVCGQAANQGVLVWAADLKPCTQRSHGDYFGNQCKRLLAVPLRHRDQVLGVYNLFFDSDARLEREHLRAAVLHERQMLANEVHDAVAQTLYFMNMRLPLLHDALLQHDDTRALRYHADLRQAVSDAYASLREILTHYRTRMDPKGLLHALQALQAGYRDRTGIELVLDNRAGDLCLSVDQELQVFHIVQEALANVLKHSRAHKAQVLIEPSQERLVITIEDDGAGLLPAAAAGADAPHFGLEIMCERAQRLGGSLSIHSADGGGTCVQLSIPRARAEAGPRP
jgi:two-component system nitrate/nitrite sensor histidine kinase NarX